MSPAANLTTYNGLAPKSSQNFVEFTEIFGENDNCDLCGELFEKHSKDLNFEVNLKFDKMQEVLNQTCVPTLNPVTRKNSNNHKTKRPKLDLIHSDPSELVASPTNMPQTMKGNKNISSMFEKD